MRRPVALALACALASGATFARAAAGDDALPQAAYVRAVEAMRSLANPAYATYDSIWHSTGLGFDFSQDERRIVIDVGYGTSFVRDRTYRVAYRSADRLLRFSDDTEDFVGEGHLLEPAWAGAYDILRYGMRGGSTQVAASPAATTSPAVPASPVVPGPLATERDIANVTAISPLFYRVSDEGTRPCPGIGDGRALHLIARHGAREHPLTDVVLDPATGRFCSMTFTIKESSFAGVTGTYTIDFAPYGAYWLIADGLIDVNVRLFGISAKHATLQWNVAHLATPAELPPDAFATPARR